MIITPDTPKPPLYSLEARTSGSEMIAEWRNRYDTLIAELGQLGSEVAVDRTLEQEKDIPPFSFVEDARHVFVFPPQEMGDEFNNSEVLNETPGYWLEHEVIARSHDIDRVEGRLEVRYGDSHGRVAFKITDLLSTSILSPEVMAVIERSQLPVYGPDSYQ